MLWGIWNVLFPEDGVSGQGGVSDKDKTFWTSQYLDGILIT